MTVSEKITVAVVHQLAQDNASAIQQLRKELNETHDQLLLAIQALRPVSRKEQIEHPIDPGASGSASNQPNEPVVAKAEIIEVIVNTEDDCELISSYPIEAEQEEEDEFESIIPSYLFEEDDDSLNFDLFIPSFLFDEEENSSKQVKFQSTEVISSTVNCEKLGCLKELVLSHSKVIGRSRFSLLLDASRSIFDRGKRIPNSFNSNEKLIIPWISSLGYQLDFSPIHLTARLCINDAAIISESNMFDILSESVNLSVVGENFFWQLKMATVFDPGKAFQLLKRLFSFHCDSEDNLDAITSCVIVILGYYFDLLWAYSTVTLFVQNDHSSDDRKMFHRRPQLSSIFNCESDYSRLLYDRGKVFVIFNGYFSFDVTYKLGVDIITSYEMVLKHGLQVAGAQSSYTGNLNGSVFDRGRGMEHIRRYYCLNGNYECYSDTTISCLMFIKSILMEGYHGKSIYVLIVEPGYRIVLLFQHSKVLLFVANRDSCEDIIIINFSDAYNIAFDKHSSGMGDSYKMLAEIGGDWILVTDFSESITSLFLLWARVMRIKKIRQWPVQIFLFLTTGGLVMVEFFRVSKDRHLGNVPHILLQALQMMIHQGVKQCSLNSLHLSSFSCSELYIFERGLFVHYLLPAPKIYSSCLLPMGIIMVTHILMVVFQILTLLPSVGYLRCKFRLVPPDLWSVKNVCWIDTSFISLVSLYCTSAGNAFLQMLTVEGGQIFLHSVIRTGPCYLHYNHPEVYGYIHLWSLNGAGDTSDIGELNIEMSERYILMLHILSTRCEILLAVLPVSTGMSNRLNLSRMGLYIHFLWPPSEVCVSLETHKRILLQARQFPDVVRRFDEILEHLKFHGWLTVKSCIRSQLLGVRVMVEGLAYLFLHCRLPGPVIYEAVTTLGRIEMVLKMLLWVGYLRWKFQLVPPNLWSLTKASWIGNRLVFIVFFSINCAIMRSNLFCEAGVSHHTAATVMRLERYLDAAAYFLGVSSSIVLSTTNYFNEIVALHNALWLGVSSRWKFIASGDININRAMKICSQVQGVMLCLHIIKLELVGIMDLFSVGKQTKAGLAPWLNFKGGTTTFFRHCNLQLRGKRVPGQNWIFSQRNTSSVRTGVEISTFLIGFNYEVFEHLKVHSQFPAIIVVPCQFREATQMSEPLHLSLGYQVKINASGTPIDTSSSTQSYADKGPVYLGRTITKELPLLLHFESVITSLRLTCSLQRGQSTAGLGMNVFMGLTWDFNGILVR